MGFNKKFVKPLLEVKEQLEKDGIDNFVRFYVKADVFIGPSDSIMFIDKVIESYYQKENDESINLPEGEFTH